MNPETLLTPLLDYAVQHPEQIAGLVAGLGTVIASYARTGKLPIGRLPYRHLRDLLGELRATWFTKRRPRGVPALVVDAKPADVEDTLREHHFEDTDFDYKYTDERWSLRRPEGERTHPGTGEQIAMELHPRGFETDDGRTLVPAHLEASRYEEPGDHYRETVLSWNGGQGRMATILRNDTDLEFEKIESERSADVTVVS